jgi:hypothetical protein
VSSGGHVKPPANEWGDLPGTHRLTDEGLVTNASSDTISGGNSVKSGGPSSISQHNFSNFTIGIGWKFWCN